MFENKDYIIRIAEERSFSKASKSLNVSQPALSASVKRLEERLGAPIFDRKTKPIELTEVGREYLRIANEIQQKEDAFESYVKRTKGTISGHLKIGGSILFSSFVLPSLISEFTAKYPRVSVELVERSSDELFEMLKHGELDIVIDNMEARDPVYIKHPYTTEMVVLGVPTKYALPNRKAFTGGDIQRGDHLKADAPTVSLKEFSDCPFIFMNDRNDTGKRAVRLVEAYNMNPKVLFTVSQQMTSYNLCESGIGATLCSDTIVKNVPKSSQVVFYKLDRDDMTRLVSFYERQKSVNDVVVQAFIDLVEKESK